MGRGRGQARRELTPASIARGAVVCHEPPPAEWTASVTRCAPSVRLSRRGRRAEQRRVEPPRRGRRADAVGADRAPGAVGDTDRSAAGARGRDPGGGRRGAGAPGAGGGAADGLRRRLGARGRTARAATGSTSAVAAVAPIVELARWGSAAAGVFEGSTPERLLAAGHGGALSEGDARTLADAFDLALELRIGHHMGRIGARPAARRRDRTRRDQPADARSPARRVPGGDLGAAEASRVRLRRSARGRGGRVRAGRAAVR